MARRIYEAALRRGSLYRGEAFRVLKACPSEGSPLMQSAYANYKTHFAVGSAVNFYQFVSFTTDMERIDAITSGYHSPLIVLRCKHIVAFEITQCSVVQLETPLRTEAEVLCLPPSYFVVTGTPMKLGTTVIVDVEYNEALSTTHAYVHGPVRTKRECNVEAINCDAHNSIAYHNLGTTLAAGESVTLKDGRALTERECYVEAVNCDARYSKAYHNLGCTLAAGESVTLRDGRVLTERECYVEAINCDARCSDAYHGLGTTLAAVESVTLKDGRALTKRECYVEAINCDARNSKAFFGLGTTLVAGESVTLKDGRALTERECYVEAINCNASYSKAYHNLGCTLAAGEGVTLRDGRVLTKRECLELGGSACRYR